MKFYSGIFLFLLSFVFSSSLKAQEVEAGLSTGHLVRGEIATFYIKIINARPTEFPNIPELDRLILKSEGRPRTQLQIVNGKRTSTYEFVYRLQTLDEGALQIPSIEVSVEGGQKLQTPPMQVIVHSADKLQWNTQAVGNYQCEYASALFTDVESPYESQAISAEYKIYLPRELSLAAWGQLEVEKENLLAHRFDSQSDNGNFALLKGKQYVVGSYRSIITPTKSGVARIGPANATVNFVVQRSGRGFFSNDSLPVKFDFGTREIDVKALPSGAPKNFQGLVGKYNLTAEAKLNDLKQGDPISVDLNISGLGNIAAVKTPYLTDEKGWKLYPATQKEDEGSRKSIYGFTQFTQILRPLEAKTEIPPFELTFFNPDTEQYQIVRSTAIPLPEHLGKAFTPSIAENATSFAASPLDNIPSTRDVPTEALGGILGFLPTENSSPSLGYLDAAKKKSGPSFLWQLIPLVICLSLIGNFVRQRMQARAMKNPELLIKKRQLEQIENASKSSSEFYKQVNNYINRWIDSPDQELQDIINDGERACFAPNDQKTELNSSTRSKVLSLLRSKTLLFVFAACLLGNTQELTANPTPESIIAKIESDSPDGNYTADQLYNLGVAHHRQGSSGKAQLMFHRALVADSNHKESKQNLRFLSEQNGAIIPGKQTWEASLTYFSNNVWKNLNALCLWVALIGLLLLLLYRNKRILGTVLCVLGFFASITTFFAIHKRPDFPEKAPLTERAIIIADDISAHTDASASSETVIETPPGTLCRLIAERGNWSYVAIGTQSRGWVPNSAVELLIPQKEVPKS